MLETNQIICENATNFVKNLFKIYLEDRNFPLMMSMFHKDISWFGTGAHEICKNYEDAVALIEAEKNSWDGHFKILKQWYRTALINDQYCIVFGELKIIEDGLNTFLLDMNSRFSIICKFEKGEFKVYHAHFSVPNSAQNEEEFIHKTLVQDYDVLLEKTLQERTKMLKDKTQELQTLTDNIYGGVEICDDDDGFTINYVSDGFVKLTGYSQEEIAVLFENKHIGLVVSEDVNYLRDQMKKQLAIGNTFVIEYRIKRKDGVIIWILNKGLLIASNNKEERKIQSILMDITEQKEREEALKFSEKRYEIAMQSSKITMFEYNVTTKELQLFEDVAKIYGVSPILKNGVETFIKKGFIEPESINDYRELYQKIDDGEEFAKAYIKIRDAKGSLYDFELSLTNVFNSNGKPIRAIGVQKNVAQMRQLQKEKEFGETLASNKNFVCEADVTNDLLIKINRKWTGLTEPLDKLPFSQMIIKSCEKNILPEYRDLFLQKFSNKNIIETFKKGKKLISFSYQRKDAKKKQCWFEAIINIIEEEMTGNINIRYYTENIDKRKRKEEKVSEEKRLYATMFAKASLAYEVNITRDTISLDYENWEMVLGIPRTDYHSSLINYFCEKLVYSEDKDRFIKVFSRENTLQAFTNNQHEIVCEYRKYNKKGNLLWFKYTLHFYEDSKTNDIKGYAYVEDIDKQKKTELALQYKAEHDSLTSFYNKASTEKYITECFNESNSRKHAIIMVDIDYFKSINDNFGHVFGDAVLSQISAKIRTLFRDDDIIGRIGGDEFIILIKNISDITVATIKAEEICAVVEETYYKKGKAYKISASVGIAMYGEHGETYEELYHHSDSALYTAKHNGRNQIAIYENNTEKIELEEKEFDKNDLLTVKFFEENISEYVFRILYESKDKEESINAVLGLIGKHLDVSRVYVFENSQDDQSINNTYEWCNLGIKPEKENLQNVPYESLDNYQENFNQEGIFYLADVKKAPLSVQEILEPQKIKSMLQFSIFRENKFSGFIGFDLCDDSRVPEKEEVSLCYNIAQILGMFILEMRSTRKSQAMESMALSIVNGLDSYAYVCDPKTYRVLFINDKTLALAPMAKIGDYCFEAFWNRKTVCDVCPMQKIKENNENKNTMELYNLNLKVWVKTTASFIHWQGGKKACLVNSVDITEYKKLDEK